MELLRPAEVAGAAALAVVAVAGDPLLLARQIARGVGVLDAADAVEQVGKPARHRRAELHHLGQAHRTRRRGGFALGHDEVAEALALAERPGGVAVGFAFEQDEVAVGAQDGFERGLPGGVGDLHHLGEAAVGDALGAQPDAEARDLGVARRAGAVALAAQGLAALLEGGDQLALLAAQRGERGVGLLVLLLQRHGVGAVLAGELGAQHVALFQQAVEVAHAVVGGEVALLGSAVVVLQALALGLRGLLLGAHDLQALARFALLDELVGALVADAVQGLALGGELALELGDLQARHDLGFQRVDLVGELLPLQEAVGLGLLLLGLGLEAVEVDAELAELALGGLLLLACGLVVVQHLLVAEDVEDELEQRLGGVFAQLVGVALLERQHLGDRRGQAAPGEAVLVVAQADPVVGVFQRLDRQVAVDDGVVADPVAAGLADAAGERDLVGQAGEEGPLAGVAGQVGDHRADPREAAVGAAHVAAEVALARAAQREQRAQGVEQRGLARAVGADDGDDLRVQRQREAPPEVPVDELEGLDVEHGPGSR